MELIDNPRRRDDLKVYLPEVADLAEVPQRPDYHAEGNALIHTSMALAALPKDADVRVIWATVLHDIGKTSTTCLVDGVLRSYGHAKVGADMVPDILNRCGQPELEEPVAWLVHHHQFHLAWQNLHRGEGLSRKQARFCRHPLFPLLLAVCRADAAASKGSDKCNILEKLETLINANLSLK